MIQWAVVKTLPWKWIGIGLVALGIISGTYFGVSSYNSAITGLAEYKAEIQKEREANAAEAIWKEHDNEMRRERANAENAQTKSSLTIALNSLRSESDRRAFKIPEASQTSSRPDLACFDRAELSREVGEILKRFRGRTRELADEGTANTVDLNTAKKWVQEE